MTAIARFEVVPVREGSMAEPIARAIEALERHGVIYETTPTDTIIEADDLGTLFAAVRDAHEAISDEQRVLTELEIDFQPGRRGGLEERVRAVERELGHPPRSERAPPGRGGKSTRHEGSEELPRYEGGRRGQEGGSRSAPMRPTAEGGRQPASSQGRRYGSRRF